MRWRHADALRCADVSCHTTSALHNRAALLSLSLFPPALSGTSCRSQQCSMYVHVVFDAMHHGATSTERRLGMRGGWLGGWAVGRAPAIAADLPVYP